MNKIRDNEVIEQVQINKIESTESSSTNSEKKQNDSSANNAWLNQALSKESAVRILPFLLYLTVLGMLYIANKHYTEKNIRQIEKINKELKELKWEHMTTKHELMFKSKQTELAKSTAEFGLKEAVVPPIKIVVNK